MSPTDYADIIVAATLMGIVTVMGVTVIVVFKLLIKAGYFS